MAEYIEKQAAQDVLCDACGNAACPRGLIPRCSYYERMQDIPPADVRPVVLCKDCDLWNEWDSSGRKSLGNYRCSCAEWTTEITTYYTGPDEFCSRGERKGGDAK